MIIINTTIPTPSVYDPDIEPVADANRLADGTMSHKIKFIKRKLNCSWRYLTLAQTAELNSLVHVVGRSGGFAITYPGDPISGTTETRNFYASPTSHVASKIENNEVVGYFDVKCNFIEI